MLGSFEEAILFTDNTDNLFHKRRRKKKKFPGIICISTHPTASIYRAHYFPNRILLILGSIALFPILHTFPSAPNLATWTGMCAFFKKLPSPCSTEVASCQCQYKPPCTCYTSVAVPFSATSHQVKRKWWSCLPHTTSWSACYQLTSHSVQE